MSGSAYWDDQVLLAHLPDAPTAVAAWLRLLLPGGALMLIEGRWHTGPASRPPLTTHDGNYVARR